LNNTSVASCGVICDLCSGFQRNKNKCVGCNNAGNKPYHCTVCSIKSCPEKNGNEKLCNRCDKFPCKRIKHLDQRYRIKYGESPIENLQRITQIGLENFINLEKEKWKCIQCGQLVCVHRNVFCYCSTFCYFTSWKNCLRKISPTLWP
jgi:hypothetical protein